MNVILTETIREKHARGVGGHVVKAGVIARLEKYWKSLHVPATRCSFLRLALPGCTRAGECTQRLNAGEN